MSERERKRSSIGIIMGFVAVAAAMLAVGYFVGLYRADGQEHGHIEEAKEEIWTCSMDPQIRQSEPGKCPICDMALILLEDGKGDGLGEREIEFSEGAKKLMEVETAEVQRRFAEGEIRLVGKVDYDETGVKYITAWTPGRIDRLYVDYTGIEVRQGDHMVYLYSPQLLADQQALLTSIEAAKRVSGDGSQLAEKLRVANIDSARARLRLQGLNDKQIAEIEAAGKPFEHITIYAPIGGVVIEKAATEGMYVQTGSRIYTIADLSSVWVMLDAYESDMAWLRYGQDVEFSTEAYPGEVFAGKVSFIDPFVDARTRTVKLRVNVDNTDGKLKPEMFVRAVVKPMVAKGGKVMDAAMAGKWICPMHPEVVKDIAGICPVCEMDLVTTESLGYVTDDSETAEAPLVIPVSAPLITGKRAIVYVELSGKEKPTYEGREVVLGPRAGGYYIVLSGLVEGERVVVQGNFKIDSAMQLQAKPSMMSPAADKDKVQSGGEEILQKLCPVMGGPINKDVFTMYKGKKVYFCCPGCDTEFNKDPEKYISKLPQFNE